MTDSHSRSSTDVLMHLIVALLAPMFVQAAGGDMNFARAAAAGTVNDYRARNHIDLLAIAQIIGFGLTALGSLGLSMADDITVPMILRLRTSAVASNRASEACRRVLAKSRLASEPAFINGAGDPSFSVAKPAAPQEGATKVSSTQSSPAQSANIRSTDIQAINPVTTDTLKAAAPQPAAVQPAAVQTASVQAASAQPAAPQPADTRPASAQPASARTAAVQPADTRPARAQSSGAQATTGIANLSSASTQPPKALAQAIAPFLQSGSVSSREENRSFWANAMSSVAANVTASLPHLPPAERRAASIRADALSGVARELLTDNKAQPRPPFALPR